MIPRLVRSALAACTLGSVACGLVFAPGDYADVPLVPITMTDTGPDAVTAPDADAEVDAGARTRVLLVAGRRDSIAGESSSIFVAETMRATISLSPSVELGPWSFDVAPPTANGWSRAVLAGQRLLLQSSSNVYETELTDRVSKDWRWLPPRGAAPATFFRPWIVSDAGLTAAGGQLGAVFTDNVYVAPFDFGDAGTEAWQLAASKLVKARGDVTLLAYGRHVYAIGGRDNISSSAPGRDEVEVASFGPDGTLSSFVTTTKLTNPSADAASHGVIVPIVASGAGHVFVIGGQRTASSSSLTDVVLASKVDDATGALGPWIALPRLLSPLGSAAAIVFDNTLLIFGGIGVSAQTDAVMALSITPQGFGSEWTRVGSLPSARSALAAVAY